MKKKGPAEASLEPSPSGGEIESLANPKGSVVRQTNASMHRFIGNVSLRVNRNFPPFRRSKGGRGQHSNYPS